jgi:predicted transcriptional regulator
MLVQVAEMRRKVGTVLDEEVLRAAKVLAARENRRLSEVIEEALREYLKRRELKKGVVRRSRGALSAPRELVQEILAEEDFLGE